MIQKAFVDESMDITQIKEWHRRFKNGLEWSVRELEYDLGIPKTTVWEILNKILGMTRVCAKFIPKLLTTEQKDVLSKISQDNLEMVSDDENVFKKVITGDESWVYGFDPETKLQSSQ